MIRTPEIIKRIERLEQREDQLGNALSQLWSIVSGLGGGGSGFLPVISTVSDDTALTNHTLQTVFVDASGGPVTITLPPYETNPNIVFVKKVDSTTNTVTIVPTSGLIDGFSSALITQSGFAYGLEAPYDTSNWEIITGRNAGLLVPTVVYSGGSFVWILEWTVSGGLMIYNGVQVSTIDPIVSIITGGSPNVPNGTFDLTGLAESLTHFECNETGSLAGITCTNMGVLQALILESSGDPGLTTLDLTGDTALTLLTLTNNALVNLSIAPCTLLLTISASGCAFNVATVNSILTTLAANGLSNGTCIIDGGTSAAPTGAGATAKTTLQGRGWTVNTN